MSLSKKLAIKAGHQVLVMRAPQAVVDALELPAGAKVHPGGRGPFDVVLVFVSSAKGLSDHVAKAIAAVKEGGVLWFAYPKKTSGVASDLSRDEGWQVVRARGFGPVAQVAIDATWSAVRWRPESEIERAEPVDVPEAAAPKRPTEAKRTSRDRGIEGPTKAPSGPKKASSTKATTGATKASPSSTKASAGPTKASVGPTKASTTKASTAKAKASVAKAADAKAAKPAASKTKEPAALPPELEEGLRRSSVALATWQGLAPSHVREYLAWIREAKKAETRSRRAAQALEMLERGIRDRNQQYAR